MESSVGVDVQFRVTMAKLLALSLVLTLGLADAWNDCESRSYDTAIQSLKSSR